MTATILRPGAQITPNSPTHDPMQDTFNDLWHRQNYHPMTVPVNHVWPQSHDSVAGGMHDTALRMFHEQSQYNHTFHHDVGGQMMSPLMAYMPDTTFGSDMDVGTPSTTAGFPDAIEGYHTLQHTSNPDHHFHLSARPERAPSIRSTPSSLGGVSPHQSFGRLPDNPAKVARPNYTRSITAPEASELHGSQIQPIASPSSPPIKRSGSDDDDDEVDIPIAEMKPRGRKRQRIPHTAVERRYRENLNAHLDKLRQTVPSLASKRTAGTSKPGDGMGDGVKPSKCEVLHGAIEHINVLGTENSSLKREVVALRARLEELERWYGAAAQRGF